MRDSCKLETLSGSCNRRCIRRSHSPKSGANLQASGSFTFCPLNHRGIGFPLVQNSSGTYQQGPCNCWRSSFVGPAAKAEAGVGTHYPATSAAANYCPAGLKRLSVGKAVQHPLVTLSCHRKSGVVTSAPRKQGRLLERANQGRGSLDSLFFVGDSCPYIARI